jgi:hypothetical protein
MSQQTFPGMGKPDVGGMLQRRMNARLQPGAAQKACDDGLFSEAARGVVQVDLKERTDMKPRYRFSLVCPQCKRTSETTCEWSDLHANERGEPVPSVNCGDCLMERVEVVGMKVTRVEVMP